MTIKRWFWFFTVLVMVYLIMAARFEAAARRDAASNPGEGRALRAQNGLSGYIHSLLMPATWAFSKVQGLFSHAPSNGQSLTPEQVTQVLEENRAMRSENSQLQTELTRRINELRQLHNMPEKFPSLSQASVLTEVNVIGHSLSGATDLLTLDCGQRDHVVPGMLVISSFAPVGQVIAVGPMSCTVRVITDSRWTMRIKATIKRIVPGNPTPKIIVPLCEVAGIGQGRLTCSVSANNPEMPQPGDVVVVKEDSTWRPLDGAFIGDIEKLDRDDAHVRYDIAIRPYADIANLRQVWVVLLPP